ncbi:MAG: class I SAM-dependent methyltransferase [Candidatus Vogelbacteria bacterium]|nr:class I SAM-dependent methyltransferase [Candidatus Vogelbacteria bacterium]
MKVELYATRDDGVGRGIGIFGLKDRLLSEIKNRITKEKSIRILEVGCGRGILMLDLLRLFPTLKLTGVNKRDVHGIKDKNDLSLRAKELGLELSNKQIPEIYFSDATKLPFADNTFDIIISQVTFLHIENKAKALSEIYRVLKPCGIALLSLGGYSIRRKIGFAMPQFYKKLRCRLDHDFNPRFLIKSGDEFLPFSNLFNILKQQYDVEQVCHPFVSRTQRGITHKWIMNKEAGKNLKFPLKYLPKESSELTKKYAKKNPVNWGVIDVYDLKQS